MINSYTWFKIIAGKNNKIPEFYTIVARKMPDYIIRQRDRGQAEAKASRPRPRLRPKLPRPRPRLQGLNITDAKTCARDGDMRVLACRFNASS